MSSAHRVLRMRRQLLWLKPWNEQPSTALQGQQLARCISKKAKQPPIPEAEDIPEPPSSATAIASMGFGAIGAVGIAAVGVYGAFKMALWAAKESGRSMDPKTPAAPTPVSPPTKAQLEEELAELRKLVRTPEIDSRKAVIKKELRAT